MAGRILVTGASGFVGRAVIAELLERGYAVRALVNRRPVETQDPRVESVSGGLFDPAALDRAAGGCDAVIHLVGIIMERPLSGITFHRIHVEGTRNIVSAAQRSGISRYIHMSALGTRPSARSTYHKTKYAAELIVRESGLRWTIFRPSLIHGPKGEFMQMEKQWAKARLIPPFMPYFGAGLFGRGGAGLLQPVFVGDVARAFVDALSNEKTVGEVYPIAGPDQMTWPQMHRTVATSIRGKPKRVAALPVGLARTLTYLIPGSLLGFNRDQIIMSQEDNTTDLSKFTSDFGWTPRPFKESLDTYATAM